MNVCMFIGNLTADPEMRYSPTGKAVTTFSIAINERRGDKEETEFLDFISFETLAERVAEYCRKGRKIAVQASFHTDRWNAEDGTKRTRVRFRARNVEFLDKPAHDDQPQAQRAAPQQQRAAAPPPEDEDLSDLPF